MSPQPLKSTDERDGTHPSLALSARRAGRVHTKRCRMPSLTKGHINQEAPLLPSRHRGGVRALPHLLGSLRHLREAGEDTLEVEVPVNVPILGEEEREAVGRQPFSSTETGRGGAHAGRDTGWGYGEEGCSEGARPLFSTQTGPGGPAPRGSPGAGRQPLTSKSGWWGPRRRRRGAKVKGGGGGGGAKGGGAGAGEGGPSRRRRRSPGGSGSGSMAPEAGSTAECACAGRAPRAPAQGSAHARPALPGASGGHFRAGK